MNNDRFKFRVWDINKKIYNYNFNNEYLVLNEYGELVYDGGFEGLQPISDINNYIIMQCTGLKDKNGKLIYEGDIVKFRFGIDTFRGEIVFCYENYCLLIKTNFHSVYDSHFGLNHLIDSSEITGNIYETPCNIIYGIIKD